MANWKGTAVPNSGVVENVYFNTSLSIEEVVEILESVELFEMFGGLGYIVLLNSNGDSSIQIVKVSETNFAIQVILNAGETSFIAFSNEGFDGVVGWGQFVNPIAYNQTAISEMEGISFGTQNDKLSSLFSITPFTQSEDKNILMHPYNEDGTANKEVNLYPRTKVGNLLASNGNKFTMPNVVYKDGSLYEPNEDGSANTEKPIEVGISEEQVNTLIDNKITGWLGGES